MSPLSFSASINTATQNPPNAPATLLAPSHQITPTTPPMIPAMVELTKYTPRIWRSNIDGGQFSSIRRNMGSLIVLVVDVRAGESGTHGGRWGGDRVDEDVQYDERDGNPPRIEPYDESRCSELFSYQLPVPSLRPSGRTACCRTHWRSLGPP
jgi:hypothetical protein